jgi:uncharacterized protein YcfL
MKTNCFLLFLGLTLLACQSKEVNNNSSLSDSNETKIHKNILMHSDDIEIDKTISFHSDGNDMADIKLSIDKNHTFQLHMEIFPDEEGKNDTSIFEKFNGNWIKKVTFYI